jgi:NAD(P)-dependent dehydrogenase (short-subunit alcohol dehydrogenase family)
MGILAMIRSQLFASLEYPTTSCEGKTIIVTGSNTGLGKEAARHFARLGAEKVILAVRNTKAGEAAREDIISTTKRPAESVQVWELDLSSYESVKKFADRASSELKRVDVLMENAGIATQKWQVSEGWERTLMVNVLGTFYLAFLMLPKLKAVAKEFNIQPRLTIVSSEVHEWTKFPEGKQPEVFKALNDEKKTNMGERYQTSKLLEVLTVREIAPKLEGSGVILNMLNPGLCHSELSRDAGIALEIIKFFLARSTEKGSRTLCAAGFAGPESHGQYMTDGKVAPQAVSDFARSAEGKKEGGKVWKEMKDILEAHQPGVTESVA